MLNWIVIPSNEKNCKEKNAPKKTAKYGQKWTKTAKKKLLNVSITPVLDLILMENFMLNSTMLILEL